MHETRSIGSTLPFVLAVTLTLTLTRVVSADDLAKNHPRPDYAGIRNIAEMAEAVRASRPPIHRGGWEWDRLLTRYIDNGRKEENALVILQAYFRSILDRQGKEGRYPNFFAGHGAWGSGGRLRIYQELVRQKMLTRSEQRQFRKIVSEGLSQSFDYPNIERGANNRPYGMNGGTAIALQLFPKLPQAERHRRWLNALWRELQEYGDTTETNYFPYGPLYLDGLLDIAEGMGKFKTDRDFLYAHFQRYLDYVHGGGVRGNPNSGSQVSVDRRKAYLDPWNSAYYGQNNEAQVWYRLAKEYRSPEFLWAAEQACLGGRPPAGRALPSEYREAFRRRFSWFVERRIKPRPPQGSSRIGYYSPLKHKVPERLYLCSSRASGKPFASFYLYDRNNNYMHYNDDVVGQLYEYAVDGAKLLHTSGKYNSNVMKIPAAYDAFWVQHPAVDFATGRAGDIPFGTWKTLSLPLPGLLNSRHGPDSTRWKYNAKIGLFRRVDEPLLGYAHGNMDGYWYLNNELSLDSLEFELIGSVVELCSPRLSGPKGEKALVPSWKRAPNLTVVASIDGKQRQIVWRGGDPANDIVSFGQSAKGEVLRVRGMKGTRYSVHLSRIDLRFDVSRDYTRLLMDHNGRITSGSEKIGTRGGHQAGITVNDRMQYLTYDTRGGILDRASLRAETRDGDSFGQFRYSNYFGPHARWTRQSILTAEGYLVVRDVYEPDRNVAGYVAGPCWLLRPNVDWKSDDQPDRGAQKLAPQQNWFDGPAWDHAWWQKQRKRVLLWMHPQQGQTFGVTAHATTADISRSLGFEYYPTQNCHATATLEAGKAIVFLSVLVPFDEGQSVRTIVDQIATNVSRPGECSAKINQVSVTIRPDGSWSVLRP